MHDPDALVVSSPQGRRLGRLLTWGVPCLVLVLVLGMIVANLARELQFYARLRVTGPRLDSPDQVQVLSAVWKKRDLFQITVRLRRSDGKPMYNLHGIRLTDTAADGYGEISDYVSRPRAGTPAVDIVAYQRLSHAPSGPLTLRIDGLTMVPRITEPGWVPFFLGPPKPRPQGWARYPLSGGEVTLPAPPKHAIRKQATD